MSNSEFGILERCATAATNLIRGFHQVFSKNSVSLSNASSVFFFFSGLMHRDVDVLLTAVDDSQVQIDITRLVRISSVFVSASLI